MMNTKNRAQHYLLTPIFNIAKHSLVAVVISFGVMSSAIADWSGGIEGGTALSGDGGNATRLRLKLSNNEKPLSHYVYADWIRDDLGSNFEVGYKPRYWFGEALYLFGEARARQDKPRLIDRELFGLTGVGVDFLRTENRSLYAELGVGYRTTEFDSALNLEDDDDTVGVARAGFQQILLDLLSLELEGNSTVGDQVSRSVAEASIAVRIPGGVIKYSYRTQRNEIGEGDAVTSSDSFVSFNYGF